MLMPEAPPISSTLSSGLWMPSSSVDAAMAMRSRGHHLVSNAGNVSTGDGDVDVSEQKDAGSDAELHRFSAPGVAPVGGSRPNREWIRSQIYHITDLASLKLHHTTDQSTLRKSSWTPSASTANDGPASSNQRQQSGDQALFKLTQAEFKRLKEQVRDVGSQIQAKFKANGLKKYLNGTRGDAATQVYRSQLASSMKAFRDKQWLPYEQENIDTRVFRCRPISRTACSRPSSRQEPASRPGSGRMSRPGSRQETQHVPHPPDHIPPTPELHVQTGDFDTLTPEILYRLSGRKRLHPGYGDQAETGVVKSTETLEVSRKDTDLSSTSGICTDRESDGETDSNNLETLVLDREQMQQKAEQNSNKLDLRPEQMDAVYYPEPKKSLRRYDFDASKVEIPPYEFASPLSENMKYLDLKSACAAGVNWRDTCKERPKGEEEMLLIDRLQALRRLELQTVEWEERKQKRVKSAKGRQRPSSSTSVRQQARVTSAKSNRERKCCPDCMQLACVGDCPLKRQGTEVCTCCGLSDCDGECPQTPYDLHERGDPVDMVDDPEVQEVNRPRSGCGSCTHSHNARNINVNNMVLGRPHSCHATFSQGQNSVKPRNLRSRPGTPFSTLESDLSKLDLESGTGQAVSRPSTAGSTGKRRFRGRAALNSGKSFFSQRRESLTEGASSYSPAQSKYTRTRRCRSARKKDNKN